jgi:hypothetical protein
LRKGGFDHPVYATEGESPDFVGYGADKKTIWSGVEITETMEQGRRRNLEMKNPVPPELIVPVKRPIQEPFNELRKAIHKKAEKPYAVDCILFVYFNIRDWALSYEKDPFIPLLRDEAEIRPFDEVGCFKRVLVLDVSMTKLIELTPG